MDGARSRFRLALHAGASLLALAAIGAPAAAIAACSGADQTIASAVTGPVLSTGGGVDVQSSGSIAGNPTGILASNCSITALTNAGAVLGGAGAAGAAGGVAVISGAGVKIEQSQQHAAGTIVGGIGGTTSNCAGGAGATGFRTLERSKGFRTLALIGGGAGGRHDWPVEE